MHKQTGGRSPDHHRSETSVICNSACKEDAQSYVKNRARSTWQLISTGNYMDLVGFERKDTATIPEQHHACGVWLRAVGMPSC